ncbi:hypothetical protein F511_13847 [Dorcoceras hygrometricum]|uniref:Uncharacterized protein n=1 Tax=Dorcoceras hygrometricum TaxID=472368 RepID=A0A2Z7DCI3_9LAMI|nr:hypothetical protein F511_13847 [Dorcoceras hygrometricum]
MEILLIEIQVCGHDGQCCHKLFSNTKEARSQDFLAEFDYELQYKPGRVNVIADALSRKSELAVISLAQGHMKDRITEGLAHDTQAQTLLDYIKEGKTRRLWQSEGLLCTKGNRLYVPAHGGLRRKYSKNPMIPSGRDIRAFNSHWHLWKNDTIGHTFGKMSRPL